LFLRTTKRQPPAGNFIDAPQPEAPNYSELSSWAAHPNKDDNADLIPKPLQKEITNLHEQVDVFFVHPTLFGGDPENKYVWNASLQDATINKYVDDKTMKFQASIFNQAGRIYAPRYRQAHLRSFFDPNKEEGLKALDLAYEDMRNSFLYYLEHYNNNRPFILAGHSQGAKHLVTLLQEMFDGTPLQKKLIAAYIVGWGVEKDDFKQIPLGSSPEETGCYLTWRTYAKGYMPDWITSTEVCINPLTWTTDARYAPYKANKGSILMGFNKLRKHLFDAEVNGPVLWVGKPNLFLGGLLKRKDYHIGDLNLFYLSVRQNAILRARTYLDKLKGEMQVC